MTDENRSIFRIMDNIMEHVAKTKMIFTILIILVIIPIAIVLLIFAVFDLDEVYFYYYEDQDDLEEAIFYDTLFFDVLPSIAIIVVIGFGIRQLVILNRWTKKYKEFKDRQAELEEKSDDELEEE